MSAHPFRDGILGLAIGDALGAPAEFGERWMRDMDPIREMRSGGVFDVPAGGWTDDTAMTLAVLDSLRAGFDPADQMHRFISWLRHGEYSIFSHSIGVGQQILRAIEHFEVHGDLSSCGGNSEADNGNGSLMRILPVCLYACAVQHLGDTSDIEMVHRASSLTHRHPRSLVACGLYYFMVQSLLQSDGTLTDRLQSGLDRGFAFYQDLYPAELVHYAPLRNLSALKRLSRDEIRSTGYVVDTLIAAVWCLITETSFSESLLRAVNLGLDTDTIAAIAGGLAGLHYGLSAVPTPWLNALQRRDFIESLCAFFDP